MSTGRNQGFGKLIAEVRSWVPESTDEGLARLADLKGVPKGKYVREVLMCHVHGQLAMARLPEHSAVTALK